MKIKILILGMIFSLISFLMAERINFWKNLFIEPAEIMYVLMKDGTAFGFTDHYEGLVYMSIERLKEKLKKFKNENYRIKDIAIIIHNHDKDSRFSPADHDFYTRLKEHGFNGFFLLYSRVRNKAYNIEDKK